MVLWLLFCLVRSTNQQIILEGPCREHEPNRCIYSSFFFFFFFVSFFLWSLPARLKVLPFGFFFVVVCFGFPMSPWNFLFVGGCTGGVGFCIFLDFARASWGWEGVEGRVVHPLEIVALRFSPGAMGPRMCRVVYAWSAFLHNYVAVASFLLVAYEYTCFFWTTALLLHHHHCVVRECRARRCE